MLFRQKFSSMEANKLKVLIFEDDLLDLQLTVNELHDEYPDAVVKSTDKEEEFKSLLEEFDPDLVLSDYNLPGFDGLDAIKYVRKHYPVLPILIVTGSLDEETAASCMKIGAWDYLIKDHIFRLNPAIDLALKHKEEKIKRLKAERSLIESEEHFRALTQNSPDVIMRFDKNHRHIFVNDIVKQVVGIEPSLFINKTHKEMGLFSEEECLFWETAISKVFCDKKKHTVEFSIEAPNGKLEIEWRLFPEFSENQQVKSVLGVARDITEKKISDRLLKESRQMLKVVLDSVPISIFWKDTESVYLGCNSTFAKAAGLHDPDEIIGLTDFDLPWKESEKLFFRDADKRVMTGGEAMYNIIEPLHHFDGTDSWNNTNKVPLYDEAGKVIGVLGTTEDITEKLKAQEALKKNEERLQTALEGTSDGLIDWEVGNDEIYLSPRFFTMLGYESSDFTHKISSLKQLLHPDDRKLLIEQLQRCYSGRKEVIDIEYRLLCKNGNYSFILGRGKILYNETGEPSRIVGTHVDISLRKKHERIQGVLTEIANSVNNTRNLSELFIQIQRSLGAVIDTTNCYVALYDEETDKLTLPFHQDERDSFTEFPAGKTLTGYVIKTGEALLANSEIIRQLEEKNIIESVGAPSESWLGIPLKMAEKIIGVFAVQSYTKEVIFSFDDVKILEFVSDQIALAIERKKDQDNIRKNELRQRRIFESAPDGLVVVDMEGNILDYNSRILELLELKLGEEFRANIFTFIMEENVIQVQNVLNETLKQSYRKNIEFRMKTSTGKEFFTEASFGLIQGKDEGDNTFVITIKNINKRREYERNLKLAKEKAEESDRLKTAFLSNMSHEIRTPMNAIIGFSELLSRQSGSTGTSAEYVKQINFAADALMHLIDDIIDISKIESGQLGITYASFGLSSLFDELKSTFTRLLEQSGKADISLDINNNGYSSDISLLTDEYRLRQVFLNLLNNAVKYTEEGEISFGIKSIINERIFFYVRDTGIGISEESLGHIFERFIQGKEKRKTLNSGTGLGLAISKNIVELLGGEISVDSTEGVGSEFSFYLPYKSGKTETIVEESPEIQTLKSMQNISILIAEDDFLNFLLLKENLKVFDINIIHAKTGLEAIEQFKTAEKIDLILMDIQMPGMNGYEATKIIKEINPSIPVIAQTAYAMAGEREASINAGCDEYLSKPIKMEKLHEAIIKCLKNDRKNH